MAPRVAEQLGLHMIDRALPIALVRKLNQPMTAALAEDTHDHGSRVARLLSRAVNMSGLFVGVPLAPEELGANDHIAATERALRQAADSEGAVILGRAGVFVLKGRPDTLHVRLDGPVEARVRQAMAHEGLDERTAREMQQEADQAREAYINHFYEGARWDDLRNYHLVLDSTAVSLDTCVEVIAAAARDLFERTAARR